MTDELQDNAPWWCVIGWHRGQKFFTTALYYKTAADVLFDEFRRNRYDGREFPWLFCWRHTFELILKAVLDRQKRSASQMENLLNTCGHGLRSLYAEAKRQVPQLCDSQIDGVITFLDETDPTGMALRYPHSKKGKDLLNQTGFDPLEKRNEFGQAWESICSWGVDFPCENSGAAERGS